MRRSRWWLVVSFAVAAILVVGVGASVAGGKGDSAPTGSVSCGDALDSLRGLYGSAIVEVGKQLNYQVVATCDEKEMPVCGLGKRCEIDPGSDVKVTFWRSELPPPEGVRVSWTVTQYNGQSAHELLVLKKHGVVIYKKHIQPGYYTITLTEEIPKEMRPKGSTGVIPVGFMAFTVRR